MVLPIVLNWNVAITIVFFERDISRWLGVRWMNRVVCFQRLQSVFQCSLPGTQKNWDQNTKIQRENDYNNFKIKQVNSCVNIKSISLIKYTQRLSWSMNDYLFCIYSGSLQFTTQPNVTATLDILSWTKKNCILQIIFLLPFHLIHPIQQSTNKTETSRFYPKIEYIKLRSN